MLTLHISPCPTGRNLINLISLVALPYVLRNELQPLLISLHAKLVRLILSKCGGNNTKCQQVYKSLFLVFTRIEYSVQMYRFVKNIQFS